MTSYRYFAYGLTFESDLELPELEGAGSPPTGGVSHDSTIRIRLGSVPEHIEQISSTGVLYEAGPDEFLLRMEGVGAYYVHHGREIMVEPAEDSLESDVRVFMVGSGFGALLHQRGLLVLHASAVVSPTGGAVLFAGPSGAGKSTLLSELMKRGCSMLVDDVCAVEVTDDGEATVLAAYPRTRLWADAARRLGQDVEGLPRTRPTMDKFERQAVDSFHSEAVPLERIVLLGTVNRDEFIIDELPPIARFRAVLANTYRRQFLAGLEMRPHHFQHATAVAKSTPIVRVRRPSAPYRLRALADRVEALMRGELVASGASSDPWGDEA